MGMLSVEPRKIGYGQPEMGFLIRSQHAIHDETIVTQQQFADECNIVNILDKWRKTGLVTHVNRAAVHYEDLTNVPTDLAEAMRVIDQASIAMMQLPSKVRARFDNDPRRLLTFLQNDTNFDEAVSLGLLEVHKPPQIVQQSAAEPSQAKPVAASPEAVKSA